MKRDGQCLLVHDLHSDQHEAGDGAPKEEGQQGAKEHKDEGGFCPIGFAGWRAAAECPDKEHNEIDYWDEHQNHCKNPIADGDNRMVAGVLFLYFHDGIIKGLINVLQYYKIFPSSLLSQTVYVETQSSYFANCMTMRCENAFHTIDAQLRLISYTAIFFKYAVMILVFGILPASDVKNT